MRPLARNIANNGRDPLIVHQSCFWLAEAATTI
jgi:hypothetical protein